MNRIAGIESALRCFTFGLLALLPLAGLPFAVAGVIQFAKYSTHSANDWNPARRYALFGLAFALLGTLFTITAIGCAVGFYFEELS
jgi:hypothetical protein